MPSPGLVETLDGPVNGRWDGGYEAGDEVPPEYDALLGKLVIAGIDREQALGAARSALGDMVIRGPATNLALQRSLAASRELAGGEFDVSWLEEALASSRLLLEPPPEVVLAAAAWDLRPRDEPWTGAWRPSGSRGLLTYSLGRTDYAFRYESHRYDSWTILHDGKTWSLEGIESDGRSIAFHADGQRQSFQVVERGEYVLVIAADGKHAVERARLRRSRQSSSRGGSGGLAVKAPMPGVVVKLLVVSGDSVRSGQPVCVLEAMKMEHQLLAPADGTVAEVLANEGDRVEEGAIILSLAAALGAEPETLESG